MRTEPREPIDWMHPSWSDTAPSSPRDRLAFVSTGSQPGSTLTEVAQNRGEEERSGRDGAKRCGAQGKLGEEGAEGVLRDRIQIRLGRGGQKKVRFREENTRLG